MPKGHSGTAVGIYISKNLLERIDEMARQEQRNRSNVIAVLLHQALDGGGNHSAPHPRIAELATAYLLDHVTANEAMRQIAALVLSAPADSEWMKMNVPAPQV